ncbi:hypothetical protein RGU70_13810 [Herbaspirillum sp. RTI4]|uniref:hypothetical protein n=1 Tax=Herbaspirillum sp. RTI4 TaxID=3048640 RepID=UPI002AB57393|nr:hypothetical protein [Herbaspirillum sp. RTI4]MDY7579390.1 hypothetical protein [Herbaspirillum sp. RTI4]MEA9980304.1 hypothetical protein [Herbaspirillum sp. RTI4]
MKLHKLLAATLCFLVFSPLAQADVKEAAHEVKESTVHVVKKTGAVFKKAGRATGHAARRMGHDVASSSRKGYRAVKRSVHNEPE